MPSISARLGLPYLQPSQAQKHVTHNEALQVLDFVTQLAIEELGATTPPETANAGEIWALGSGATGAWVGYDGDIAAWDGVAWRFFTPQTGWRAYDKTTQELRVWDGTTWEAAVTALTDADGVGINTSYDAANRLSVSSPATLLTHEGAGHQLKINKAAAGDTASLLFQTGWSGRAEMGSAGTDDFSIKVSADGSTWTTGLTVSGTSGVVDLPAGASVSGTLTGTAVQQSATDTTAGRLARADYAYGPGNLIGTVSESGGTPTGAVVERGSNSNGDYVRFADGTQICTHELTSNAASDVTWTFAAGFASAPKVVGTGEDADQIVTAGTTAATTTGTTIRIWQLAGTPTRATAQASLVAIGRWF